jgi:hypothetical protein
VWQSLYASLQDRNFTVVAVALDEPDAARPWIERAKPTYPCLIDRSHHVADLYNLVNVPQAIWINEEGSMVRPPENAGSSDAFRYMDRTTLKMSDAQIAERQRLKQAYLAAVKDWAIKGAASAFVLDEASVRSRLRLTAPDRAVQTAHAHMQLAQWLVGKGRSSEAAPLFAEASRLHPESWAIWRQGAEKDATGLAVSKAFWARVDALNDRPYHRPIDMPGLNDT